MLTRLCPSCGNEIIYSRQSSFTRAEKLNYKCRSCCHRYLTDEQRRENKTARVSADRHLKSRYGITLADKQRMFADQDGKCANNGCRRVFADLTQAHLDHNHTTGKHRSLLCNQCNMALGLLHDDEATVQGLATYLQRHNTGDLTVIERSDGRGKWVRQ